MVKEFDYNEIRNSADWDEHSVASRAKKVIPGPASFQAADASKERSIAPIAAAVGAAAIDLTLLQGKAYRVIADVDVWFILKANTTVAGAAVVGADIYLPAKTAMVIKTDIWTVVNCVASVAGKIQAVEVL